MNNYLKLSDVMALRRGANKINSKADNSDADLNDTQELENLLGLPSGYTSVSNLTVSKRIAALSKSSSVPILSHVMWALVDFFESS